MFWLKETESLIFQASSYVLAAAILINNIRNKKAEMLKTLTEYVEIKEYVHKMTFVINGAHL